MKPLSNEKFKGIPARDQPGTIHFCKFIAGAFTLLAVIALFSNASDRGQTEKDIVMGFIVIMFIAAACMVGYVVYIRYKALDWAIEEQMFKIKEILCDLVPLYYDDTPAKMLTERVGVLVLENGLFCWKRDEVYDNEKEIIRIVEEANDPNNPMSFQLKHELQRIVYALNTIRKYRLQQKG